MLAGKKTATFRLYDDKDLSVNDQIQLIDKVDPQNPASWKPIGVAHINSVVQKRLGDLEKNDFDGHEEYNSPAEMYARFRDFYGPQVDEQTPVKIIHFTFYNDVVNQASDIAAVSSGLKDVKLFADGGSRGNPGPSAAGFAILDLNDQVVVKKGIYLGVTTNNQAEYQALKLGLEEVHRMGVKRVAVYMDSLLVVNQMLGLFKVKNRDLWPIHTAIKDLAKRFKKISFTHVPRQLNKLADSAVNEALDEAAK